MSYNEDELARQAQAELNILPDSNSSQPQNPTPYQAAASSSPDEPIIHTPAVVPMNLLNSPSSHSVSVLPHNPAPQRLAFQNPNRQEDLHRQALQRATYNQGESSQGPPSVDFSAQPSNYYAQAPPNPGPGPSGSQTAQTAQTHPQGPTSDLGGRQGGYTIRDRERRDERIREGKCPRFNRPVVEEETLPSMPGIARTG